MSGENELDELFLKKKPVELLVQLGRPGTGNYASALASEVDVTYSHTVKCLQKMRSEGLVEFERHGRRKEIMLTDRGDTLAEDFYTVLKDLTEQ